VHQLCQTETSTLSRAFHLAPALPRLAVGRSRRKPARSTWGVIPTSKVVRDVQSKSYYSDADAGGTETQTMQGV